MALNFAHLLFNFAHEYYGCIFIISHGVFYLFRVETFLVLFSTRGKTIFVKVANSEMGTMAYHLQSFMETRLPSSQHPWLEKESLALVFPPSFFPSQRSS